MTGDPCAHCGKPANGRFLNAPICDDCRPDNEEHAKSGAEDPETTDTNPRGEAAESTEDDREEWSHAVFSDPERGTWATEQVRRDQWMGHKPGDKQPFSPWADADATVECNHHDEPTTCDECGHSAQFKWGYRGNYTSHEEALKWAERDPRLAGLAFIQREDDPLAFVDGDDVRDPKTGEVHPVFKAFLEQLGLTYADISVSGAGVHAVYRGELPDGVKQVVWEIDEEPWGANDETPAIEIYDGKHVCIATGEHVPGTPEDAREWDSDALEDILQANGFVSGRDASAEAFENFNADDYEPNATSSEETTDDIRDIFNALDRLDARRVAEKTIVDEWVDPRHVDNRAFAPVWAPSDYEGTANFVNKNVWKDTGKRGGYGGPASMAAIAAPNSHINIDDRDCPEKVEGETWVKAVDYLRDEVGFNIPKLDRSRGDYEETDPREVDVVLDPERAWEAASLVTPDQVDGDLSLELQGDAWACPCCDGTVDVVRAAAISSGLVRGCEEPLSEDYAQAYERAREVLDAPLPQYVTAADAVEQFDVAIGAVRELDFWHLNRDALTCEVTGEGDGVGGDAVLTLDPTPVDGWRDSESGASVLVFPSGVVYEADTEISIDALRFVALDSGLVDDPAARIQGETFTEAYRLAREEYDAPLPRWRAGAPDVTPWLPPAEDLVEDPLVEEDDLGEARSEVETLYRDLAGVGEDSSDAERARLLRVLPALGKTTSAVKTAGECPTTYLAPRKELMQQAAEKAENHGVSYRHLPIFSEATVEEEALTEGVRAVREQGMQLLRNEWALHDTADLSVFDEEDGNVDDADLDRPTCPTAEGEHGEAWALAVHVARELDYTPRDIHERAGALFGSELPCEHDGDCEYSAGWDDIADPEAPVDLLIGHYAHAHVESARTHYSRGQQEHTERNPRTIVLDEYPGKAFAEKFGEDALEHALWLARAITDAVDDRHDLHTVDLWGENFVRTWLRGEADELDPIHELATVLRARRDVHEAVEIAEKILGDYGDLLETHGLAEPLEELTAAYPGVPAEERLAVASEIHDRVDEVPGGVDGFGILTWARDEIAQPLNVATAETGQVDLEPDLTTLPEGELREFVAKAVETADERVDGATAMLNSAIDAVLGGDNGARELAVWADDGYAHRKAHYLLEAVATPDADAEKIVTSQFNYTAEQGETTLKRVAVRDDVTILLDRNDRGATLLDPPERVAGGGSTTPLIGLDATGREALWELALGEEVTAHDIHDTPPERARFLRDAHQLQVVQTSKVVRSYEGDPNGKDLDGDTALLEEISEQFAGVYPARERDEDTFTVSDPAVITTKCVREVLEDDERASSDVSEWENYGNITGDNDLGSYTLAALLGCQHYGDAEIEHLAALAGEEVDRSGHGAALDYASEIANAYLQHMQEDQVMQAALRFTRGDSGALVFAHTAALRDDLPVVGTGEVVKSWSETARKVAEAWKRRHSEPFTAADVRDAVDVSTRQVRRVLAEFADAGYLERRDPGDGLANEYDPVDRPGSGEVELDPVELLANPDTARKGTYYTTNVRVDGVEDPTLPAVHGFMTPVPAPMPAEEGDPPPSAAD